MTFDRITHAENERLRAHFDRLRGLTQLEQADRDAALVEQAARWEATEREVERLRAEVAELEAQVSAVFAEAMRLQPLVWYAEHFATCSAGRAFDRAPCECGLDALLARIRAHGEAERAGAKGDDGR